MPHVVILRAMTYSITARGIVLSARGIVLKEDENSLLHNSLREFR